FAQAAHSFIHMRGQLVKNFSLTHRAAVSTLISGEPPTLCARGRRAASEVPLFLPSHQPQFLCETTHILIGATTWQIAGAASSTASSARTSAKQRVKSTSAKRAP